MENIVHPAALIINHAFDWNLSKLDIENQNLVFWEFDNLPFQKIPLNKIKNNSDPYSISYSRTWNSITSSYSHNLLMYAYSAYLLRDHSSITSSWFRPFLTHPPTLSSDVIISYTHLKDDVIISSYPPTYI